MTTSIATSAVDTLGDAFLSGDPDTVLRHFATTGDVIYAGSEPGEVAVGRAALRSLLEDLFHREERYSWRATSVAIAGEDDLLYLVAEADLLIHPCPHGETPGPPAELLPYRITGVLVRQAEGYRWSLCQGSEPAQT